MRNGSKQKRGSVFFLVMLLVFGTFYMAFVDPERIYARAFADLHGWVKGRAGEERFSPEPGQPSVTDGDGASFAAAGEDVSGPDAASSAEEAGEGGLPASRGAEEVAYVSVGDDYFADAVFIGDSRIVGMYEYGGLEETARFCAETGMTIYKLLETEVPSGEGREKATVEEILSGQTFGKVYLMVGINELGTGTPETFLAKYAEVVERIRELQPDAVIYIQGIIKVTDARSAQGDYITNEGIEERNAGLSLLADNVRVYYLDVNPVVCDGTGGLIPDYTFDGVHLKAQYIPLWKEYLEEHAVGNVPETE